MNRQRVVMRYGAVFGPYGKVDRAELERWNAAMRRLDSTPYPSVDHASLGIQMRQEGDAFIAVTGDGQEVMITPHAVTDVEVTFTLPDGQVVDLGDGAVSGIEQVQVVTGEVTDSAPPEPEKGE